MTFDLFNDVTNALADGALKKGEDVAKLMIERVEAATDDKSLQLVLLAAQQSLLISAVSYLTGRMATTETLEHEVKLMRETLEAMIRVNFAEANELIAEIEEAKNAKNH